MRRRPATESRQGSRPRLAALWLALILILDAGFVAAANREGAALDNIAALSTGAVMSLIRGGGATWYNPAGLGGNTRDQLDVSLSAFVLRDRDADGTVLGRVRDTLKARSDLESLELLTVPSSLVFSRRIDDDITVGLGVFVPAMDVLRLATTTRVEQGGRSYTQRVESGRVHQRYHAGPAIGWALGPTLRVGAAAFGVYEAESVTHQLWAELEDVAEMTRDALLIDTDEATWRFGAELTAGVQWQPIEPLHLGITVRSPVIRLYTAGDGSELEQRTQDGELSESGFESRSLGNERVGALDPLSVHGGVAWAIGDGFIALAIEYRSGLIDEATERELYPVVNAQLGGLWPLDDTIAIGSGLFTDFSGKEDPADIGEDAVDFYGVTGGVRLRTTVGLADAAAEPLVFETNIGLRYAVGIGRAGGIELDLDAAAEEAPSAFKVGVVQHTTALHIGSALLF